MYPGMATIRRQSQEEDRQRHFSAYSPTQGHPYSPTSRHEPSSPQSLRQSGIPPAAAMPLPPHISPRLGTSPSPKMNGGNQPLPQYNATPPSASTRYDPLADHRDPMGTKNKPMSQNQSPLQVSAVAWCKNHLFGNPPPPTLLTHVAGSRLSATLHRLSTGPDTFA